MAQIERHTEEVTIVKIYLADKKDFMSRETLASELDCSVEYIDKMMREEKFKEEEHYTRNGRFIRFYYPAVLKVFAPRLFKS